MKSKRAGVLSQFCGIAVFLLLTSACVRVSSLPAKFPYANTKASSERFSSSSEVVEIPVLTSLQKPSDTVTLPPAATLTPNPAINPTKMPMQTPTGTPQPELYLDQNYYCREQPDRYSAEVWTFSKGETLKVIYTKENWYLIEFSDPQTHDTACWIGGGIMEGADVASEAAPKKAEFSDDEPYIYLPQNTRCREGNSRIFRDVWFFEAGTSLNIIAIDEQGWYKVEFIDPRTNDTNCWIGIGEVHGDITSLPVVTIPDPLLQNLQDVTVSQRAITISFRDKGIVDGDRIKLTINDQILIDDYTLTESFFWVKIALDQGENTVLVTALNEGDDPPNSVEMHISHVVGGPAKQETHAFAGIHSKMIITAP